MKKRILIPTALAGILGGFVLTQTQIFSSAEQVELLTATEAKEIALKAFSGDIVDFDFDRDQAPHYEFDIVNGTEKAELVVDAQSGAVLITEREALVTGAKNSAGAVEKAVTNVETAVAKVETKVDTAVATAQIKAEDAVQKVVPTPTLVADSQTPGIISKAQAIAIAQSKASGTVVDVDYDADDLEYDIEIKNGNMEYEFEINAKTGTITKFEKDVDDDRDDD